MRHFLHWSPTWRISRGCPRCAPRLNKPRAMHLHIARTVHRYSQWVLVDCRCGARRSYLHVRYGSGYAAREAGWPAVGDRWVQRPKGGCPTITQLPKVPAGPAAGAPPDPMMRRPHERRPRVETFNRS